MNCAAAWMPASTRTTSCSCCSSNTSPTNTVTPMTSHRRSRFRRARASRTWSPSRATATSATRSTPRSSSHSSTPTPAWPAATSPTSTTRISWARGRPRWSAFPTLLPSSRSPSWISRRTAPSTTTSLVMPTSTLCGTSPAKAARARGSSTPRPKSAASWPRLSASPRRTAELPPLLTTQPAAPARCC